MNKFVIIETEAGLSVVAVPGERTPEQAAVENNGVLVDPRVFDSYEEAFDALQAIPDPGEDRDIR